MKKRQPYKLLILLVILIVPSLLFFSNCTVVKSTICSLRSTDHFISLETDSRVVYEPGAEDFAQQMAHLLPQAIEKVKAGHYRPFAKPVIIHICQWGQS